jgi:hypothetical protein
MTWTEAAELAKKTLPDWKRKHRKPGANDILRCYKYRGGALCKRQSSRLTDKREEVTCPICKKMLREKGFDIQIRRGKTR